MNKKTFFIADLLLLSNLNIFAGGSLGKPNNSNGGSTNSSNSSSAANGAASAASANSGAAARPVQRPPSIAIPVADASNGQPAFMAVAFTRLIIVSVSLPAYSL